MKSWDIFVCTYNHDIVREFCVQDAEWQKFRLSLKGVPTEDKLDRLKERRDQKIAENGGELSYRHNVQISNYITALKRGGQLGMDMKVRK